MAGCIAKKTGQLRRQLVLLPMKVLTPRLATDIEDHLSCFVSEVPRPFTRFLLRRFGNKSLRGAEIGFGYGNNAENMLKTLNMKRLYCIDPFIMQPYYEGEQLISGYGDAELNKYAQLKRDSRVTFVKLPSEQGFKELPKNLDFVYIDGNHECNFVLKDLRGAFSVVKSGGFVGGHDFTIDYQSRVIRAVLEFALEIRQVPVIEMPDFWFVKGEGK